MDQVTSLTFFETPRLIFEPDPVKRRSSLAASYSTSCIVNKELPYILIAAIVP